MAMFSTFICWELLDRGAVLGRLLPHARDLFVGGVVIERLVIHTVSRLQALTVVTVTIGLLILLNGAAAWIWAGEQRTLEPVPDDNVRHRRRRDRRADLGIIGVCLAIVLVSAFFQRTRVGSPRAVNPESSRLHGVRVRGCWRSAGASPRCSARLPGSSSHRRRGASTRT